MNPLDAALASDAGLFYSAEGRCRIRHHTDIEAQHSGLQRLDEPLAASQVLGVGVPD